MANTSIIDLQASMFLFFKLFCLFNKELGFKIAYMETLGIKEIIKIW